MFKSTFSRVLLAALALTACSSSEDDGTNDDELGASADDDAPSDEDTDPGDESDADAPADDDAPEPDTDDMPADDTPEPADDDPNPSDDAADAARLTYASIALASYEDSLELAIALDEALQAFVADPSGETLEDAKGAWLAAREPYLETEVYRFYGGPIDNDDDGPEGALNAWPLDENYIDYVAGDETSGIVNDTEAEIATEALLALNEQGGEKNIATGYHAVEFLLWGQDSSEDGPGERPYTDFLSGEEATAPNSDRRGEYLLTVSSLLVEQLSGLVDAWAEGDSENYRAEFESAEPEEALRRMLTGMIILSGFETGGERLQAALDTGDQEDEHSCFSDNTHRDMVQDVQGVWNVYVGNYERIDGSTVSGPSIRDVVELLDGDLAESLAGQIEDSLQLAEDLVPPFDREIATDNPEGNARVQSLIDALREQEDLLEEVFRGLGLSIPEPP